jgi:hypothetical protein
VKVVAAGGRSWWVPIEDGAWLGGADVVVVAACGGRSYRARLGGADVEAMAVGAGLGGADFVAAAPMEMLRRWRPVIFGGRLAAVWEKRLGHVWEKISRV